MFEEINAHRQAVADNMIKAFDEDIEKAHQDGDIHPKHPDWVWVSSAAGGKGDWRKSGGRAHQKHQAAQAANQKQEDDNKTKQPHGNSGGKLSAAEQKALNNVVDKGFKISRSTWNDVSKMSLEKTPKGNWRCYYDGKDTGNTIAGSLMSEATAKKLGMLKEYHSKNNE